MPQNVTHFLAAPEFLGGKETDAGLKSSFSGPLLLCKVPDSQAPGFRKAARIGKWHFNVRKCGRPGPGAITINWIRAYDNTAHWIGRAQNSTGYSDSRPTQTPFRLIKWRKRPHMDCPRATSMVIAIVMAVPFAQADPLLPGGYRNQVIQNEQPLYASFCEQ